MFQHLLSALESLCGAMSSGDFLSIDPNAMNAGFNAMQNAQMQAAQNQLIQSNMNNPLVQQMYQSHRQQGGTLDFPTFCLRYAETGGFTPQGYANAMHSRQQIEAQDAASMNAYRQHSQQLQESTTNYRQTVQDSWTNQRGENLSGQSPYVNSSDGSTWQLPNTAAPEQVYHDPSSGNYFAMDAHGQYWMSNGQGWWQSMNPRR
jgi:hypothetical protein